MVSRSARCRFATVFRPMDGLVARPARYKRRRIPPQAACRSGRLPAVKHGYALRALSLSDGILPSDNANLHRIMQFLSK